MGITGALVEPIWLDGWVASEALHVGTPVGSIGCNLQLLVGVGVDGPHE